MKSSIDYKPNLSFGLLLQGPPKTSKTFLSMLFPNPYIADCDNNLSGATRLLRKLYPDKEYKYDTINIIEGPDNTWTERPLHERWEYLIECCIKALADPWTKTIVLDGAASIATYLEDFIVSKKPDSKDAKMTISDWGPFRNLLSKLITKLRGTGRYLIMTSHEEYAKDEQSGRIITRTNIPSKLADNFGGFFSDVWRTEVDDVAGAPVFRLRFAPTSFIPAIGNSLGLPIVGRFSDGPDEIRKLLESASVYEKKT